MQRLALVTGGSGGIGAAVSRRLAAAGHEVIIQAHRHPEHAQALVDAIRAGGGKARALVLDVTDADACRARLEELIAERAVQILVNNAGIHEDAVFPGMSAGQWQRVIDVA